jgi:hypothetical protein
MKNRLLPLLGLALAAGLVPAGAAQDKKTQTPPPARVVLTDTLSGFSRGADKGMELRLQPPRGKGLLTGSIYVTVPPDKVRGEIPPRKPVAFEGRLTVRKVQVGMTGSVPARPILANAVSLIAERYTPLDENNRKDFPPVGAARVSGQAVPGKFKAGAGAVSPLAIANGTQPILLIGKGLEGLKDLADFKGELRAEGRLRVEQGALVLDADRVERVGADGGR